MIKDGEKMEIGDDASPQPKSVSRDWNDTVNLGEVFKKLWLRKRLIVGSTLTCVAAAFGIALALTPLYSGEAYVLVNLPASGNPAPGQAAPIRLEGSPEAVQEALQDERFVLQSRALAIRTIEQLHLDQKPEFNPDLRNVTPIFAIVESGMKTVADYFHERDGERQTGDDQIGIVNRAVVESFLSGSVSPC
jgi:uncharacterized protein involved in exopolysaccharide biosynthesis